MTDPDPHSSAVAATVLVVDDHDGVREMIAGFLASSGFTVDQASDGLEALRKVTAKAPDVVVTDLMMPVMNGFALCREIRRSEQLAHLPIIAITAHSSFDAPDTTQAGFDKVVSKSGGLQRLLAEVRAVLNRCES